jgi:hypothetical protein
MNRKAIIIAAAVVVLAVGAVALLPRDEPTRSTATRPPAAQQSVSPAEQSPRAAEQVPAHYEAPPSKSSLEPTLPPERFTGPTKDAYRVAGEIPQTLAQLPCYCHCDEGFGHKSLQSCFVDDHAAHCAVCTEEALAAYQLQKQGLTPAQIRERIIAEYSQ